jgi:hypothetical protein
MDAIHDAQRRQPALTFGSAFSPGSVDRDASGDSEVKILFSVMVKNGPTQLILAPSVEAAVAAVQETAGVVATGINQLAIVDYVVA